MMRAAREPDPNVYPALMALRRVADEEGGLLVAACSNTSLVPEDHEFNDPNTPEGRFAAELRGMFDVFVSSAHVGMRKPEREIYEYTIAELDRVARERWGSADGEGAGVRAEDVVFLDDIGANLKGAREVGMRTIRVVMGETERAVRELEEVMGLVLGENKARL